MPQLSSFFGIVIKMFYSEHEPPHFHAEYQGQRAVFDLNGKLLQGRFFSLTARRLVKTWAGMHRKELEEQWARCRKGEPTEIIEPLH